MLNTRWVDRRAFAALLFAMASTAVSTATGAQESNKDLANALRAKHIALATGIRAAETKGRPISAKYEYQDGKLQLSVYTEKGGALSEVIVDHGTGKIAKTEKIIGGDDLKDAQAQRVASAKAKTSLAAALERALAGNKGYSAVSATAMLKNGKAVAEITLMKGTEVKTVSQALD